MPPHVGPTARRSTVAPPRPRSSDSLAGAGVGLDADDAQLDAPLAPGRVADRGADQAEEVALDPLAGEVVRDADDERVVVASRPARLAEPGAVRRLVEGPAEPRRDVAPRGSPQSARLGAPPASAPAPRSRESGEHSSVTASQCPGPDAAKDRRFAGILPAIPHLSTGVERRSGPEHCRAVARFPPPAGACGQPRGRGVVYTGRSLPRSADSSAPTPSKREAHLSAQRAQPEAQARLPRAHVDARRPRDPQAPPREGPQAPLGLRRSRRCRAAPEPPLPLAGLRRRLPPGPLGVDALPRRSLVRARGRAGRAAARARRAEGRRAARSSATGSSGSCARSGGRRAEECPPAPTTSSPCGPACRRPLEARGHAWLVERVDEVLAKAAGVSASAGAVPAGHRARLAYRWTLGLLVPAGTCKYHPSCSQYAIDALRKHGLVQGSGSWRLAAAPLQPVEHGRRRPRSVIRLAPRPRVAGILPPLENAMRCLLELVPLQRRAPVGLVDRGDDGPRADDPRPADGPSDPLDAEPAGASRRR